ncbi:MAG: hypothetical protein OEX00_11750 [Gammaproteobacteria bacterium]|nr:hypothetical protein [Gammaproteobacteria bacterium]MDH5692502.1 hypothetical protein [Gammaproteobacteria bacterium]
MRFDTAVIVGGSISGLLTAAAIKDHCNKIEILDKDAIPQELSSTSRKYVPQAQHAHLILAGGETAMESLVPGLRKLALEEGAVLLDATRDWYSCFQEGMLPTYRSDISTLCISRALLETLLRKLILENSDNIVFKDSVRVQQIELGEGQHRVIYTSKGETISRAADLAVDARGRGSDAKKLVEEKGIHVKSEIVKPFIGYTSAWFNMPLNLPGNKRGLIVMARSPNNPTGAVLVPVEEGRYVLTCFGFNRNYPPETWHEILEFTRSVRDTVIYEAIKEAKPHTIKVFHKDVNYFHRFAKNRDWIDGFLVVGDAISSFNPIYGQGMATAAIASVRLNEILHTAQDTRTLQQVLTDTYKDPWIVSGNEDLRWSGTEVENRPFGLAAIHTMGDRIARAATIDKEVTTAYVKVLHMLERPTTFFHPKILLKIFSSQKVKQENSARV